MKVTLGGDRLGSGNKQKIALHNYERSTHNLSQRFTSSMQCGTLYPFLCLPAMRGDKFTINLAADARTIPTKGPLFGSFKMQVDLFQCDVRLYQAILHNNPLAIGLKMNQVKFPVLNIADNVSENADFVYELNGANAFSNSSLMKYLGLSGIGKIARNPGTGSRKVNAIPALAYYEIFKTYYANKQEENAYLIGTQTETGDVDNFTFKIGNTIYATTDQISYSSYGGLPIEFEIKFNGEPETGWEEYLILEFFDSETTVTHTNTFKELLEFGENSPIYIKKIGNNKYFLGSASWIGGETTDTGFQFNSSSRGNEYTTRFRGLEPFALSNIDDMRLELLSHHTLGTPYIIGTDWNTSSGTDETGLPYVKLTNVDAESGKNCNHDPLNGLVVKTYQSDLFNNWVNTEWIDGENGIANVTAISTAGGSIKIDSLNLAEKLYNMLNRIAVSDGSYEGWQDAVYTETPKRHIESPIYLGGMSSEIVFEEIVQTAQGDQENPLGTLAGKGKLLKRKGGHVVVKTNEAAFIIGIVSLTPRVNYSQGNEFYLTDLMSMDDFHKPALDGIGFQNLIAERMAWWDTQLLAGGGVSRHSIGKVPAWIEYMTAVDKTYGDFAETEGRGFMALNREYEMTMDNGFIKDATTYIDPRKYNYAFAVSDIEAQNFWVQIYSDITARRLMSAKQIPNI